jgi:hypothetical protein
MSNARLKRTVRFFVLFLNDKFKVYFSDNKQLKGARNLFN